MPGLTPEQRAREQIDAQLSVCGWVVQTKDTINLSAARGVAICELSFGTGEPDYTLFVDGKAIGVVEAKPEGATLTGAETQSAKYVFGVPAGLPTWRTPLPFCYESTGAETFFTNCLDPDPRARRVFSFHRPETLLACLLNQRLARLTPVTVSPKFVLYLLKAWRFRRFVDGLHSGSLIQHMFTSQLAGFTFPLPPLAEEIRIVAEVERRLSVVEELEAVMSANLQRATRLRQSILQKAFSGGLR